MKRERQLEERVVVLAEHKMTVTAESCTGGHNRDNASECSRASDVLNEGYITYSMKRKARLIDIPQRH